jgi:ABC-type cobalamin/Fe3+-siderophores transport system ATPase subunit
VTHNLAIAARYATHIALLHAGEVVSGLRQEVLDRQTLKRIYGVAVEISANPSGAPVIAVCPPEGCP